MSFADLGISKPVVRALARARHHQAFPRPAAGRPRRARRPRPARPVADRLGQDPRLRHPAGRPDRARRRAPLGPGPRPHPRAGEPDRRRAASRVARARELRIAAVYGGVGFGPQIKAARRADIVVATPGPARGPDRARRRSRSTGSASSSSTRPTGCSTWASSRRSAGSSPRPRDERQTLFFSATLEGATGKLAAAYTRDARRHTQAADRDAKADIEHRFLHVDSQSAKLDHLVEQLRERRGRPHPGLRPHQARRRPAGQAPPQPRARGGRDARRQEPGPARTGAGPLRGAATSTP